MRMRRESQRTELIISTCCFPINASMVKATADMGVTRVMTSILRSAEEYLGGRTMMCVCVCVYVCVLCMCVYVCV